MYEDISIKTADLILEPFKMDYLTDYYLQFDDEITKYQYPDSFKDIKQAELFLNDFISQMKFGKMLELAILSKEREFLGSIEAFDLDRDCPEVGLWLKKSVFRHGYGYQALKALLEYLKSVKDYKCFIYEVDIRNTASIKLVEKFPCKKGRCNHIVTESLKELDLTTYYIYLE
ncbi:MAG: GNAT family N-acetyltransferase [Erysipelotrichaceae bacterium]